MKDLKAITAESVHATIVGFITDHKVVVGDYEDMKDAVLQMIRAGYCFAMDRDRLRDAMEDITFMCSPEDDANRDRVCKSLEYDDDSDDDFDGCFSPRKSAESSGPGLGPGPGPGPGPASPEAPEDGVEDIGNTSDMA